MITNCQVTDISPPGHGTQLTLEVKILKDATLTRFLVPVGRGDLEAIVAKIDRHFEAIGELISSFRNDEQEHENEDA